MKRTKIVCTLGPAVDSEEKIRALIDAGMNVARLNCSHGDWEQKRRWIRWVRACSPEFAPVAILADLQGPKFRVGLIAGDSIELPRGARTIVGKGAEAVVPIHQPEILEQMAVGDRLVFGDGEVEARLVAEVAPQTFEAEVTNGGILGSRKGVTHVGKMFRVPALTAKDREDAVAACQAGADFIALSYVRGAADVEELRALVTPFDPEVKLCAKIETREAVHDLDQILAKVDIVMVARGDLGLQMDIEDVPAAQKEIIAKATRSGTPVITATQMLESMVHNPRPTRAEASDVYNAILDGSDAVMLSGETAAGAYPVECVQTMVRLAERAEAALDRLAIEEEFRLRPPASIKHTDAIAHAVCALADVLRPKAIVCTSTSGQTPRLVSKFRPRAPIYCATWRPRTQRQLAVVWGVEAMCVPKPDSTENAIAEAIGAFRRLGRLESEDRVIVTAGVPAGASGNTNMILTETVSE